jgi:hypothetical protein
MPETPKEGTVEAIFSVVILAEKQPLFEGMASRPVLVRPGVWNVLSKGKIEDIQKIGGYVGSSYEDLIALPDESKKMVLFVTGKKMVTAKEGEQPVPVSCLVPVGDKDADVGARPIFPHEWMGRPDLSLKPKVEAKDDPMRIPGIPIDGADSPADNL